MKAIFRLIALSTVLLSTLTLRAQQGLEGIVVEKYYQANAADVANATAQGASPALTTNTIVYRIYVDMLPGYKFVQLYGNTAHPMSVTTTTNFYNDPNYGVALNPGTISTSNITKHTAMLDSWFTTGGAANGKVGVMKTEDTDGALTNQQGILTNTSAGCFGTPLQGIGAADGFLPTVTGTYLVPSTLGLGTGNSALAVFGSGTGSTIEITNGSIAALGGIVGPTSSNRVLVAQIATDGILTFNFNVQIKNASTNVAQNYVYSNATGNEISNASLSYTQTVPVITSSSTVSCSGAQVTMTSSVTSGIQWYRGTTLLSGATSATYSSNVAGTYTVKQSCPNLTSNGISITTGSNPAAPNAVVQSGSLLLCGPSAQVVLQSTVAPSGTTGVQWYLNGSAISGATAQTYTTSTPGSYDVRRVQLSSGCSSSASTALAVVAGTVPTTPVVSLQSGALSLCSGETSTLASDVLPSASVSLQWYKDGVVQSAATAATLVANAAGSYAVKATDVSGCASALSNGVALTAVPTAVISAPSLSICNSAPVTLTSNVTNNIQWYKTGVLISGATSATYSATTAGTYTVKSTLCPLQVSNSLAVITGSAPAAPSVSTPIGAVVCSSSPITLQSSIAPSGTNSLQWYKDGAAISGATAQTYSTAVAGSYTVRRIQVSSGCPSVSSNAIAVTNGGSTPSSTSVSTQGGSTYICSSTTNNVVLVSAVAPTASTGLQWYNGSTAISGATAQSYTATVAGSYSVRRVTSTGCSSAASNALTITVGSIPSTAAITANGNTTVVCGTTPVTLVSSVAPTASATLQWYKDGVAVFNGTSQSISTLTAGSYTVRRIANCPSLASNAIVTTVGTIPAAPVVSVQSGSLATCAGVPVVLSSSVAPGSGTTLQWYSTSTVLSNATSQTYSTATAGSYRVKATSGGCTSPYSNSLTVSVLSAPGTASISVYSGSLTLCNGSTVTFKSQHSLTNSIGVRWYKDGVQIAGATSQYYTASTPGVYTARRIYTATGCLGNASSPLTVISCNPIVVNDNNEEQQDATSKLNEELVWDAAVSRNPYEQYVTIRLNSESDSDIELTMVDAMGKVVSHEVANIKELGSTRIGEGLTPGIYLISIRQDENIKTIRVIKQ